jgi:hydrogenase expression/formation protein HypC
MCLAIPMQVDSVDGFLAQCSAKGVSRMVNLFLIQDCLPKAGEHVLVHLGYALQTIDASEAHRHWEAFDAVIAIEDSGHA